MVFAVQWPEILKPVQMLGHFTLHTFTKREFGVSAPAKIFASPEPCTVIFPGDCGGFEPPLPAHRDLHARAQPCSRENGRFGAAKRGLRLARSLRTDHPGGCRSAMAVKN